MNLIHDRWIPVDRESGAAQLIAPWEITDTADPVLCLAAPRPDFNGALLQFLIGLLQTACIPDDQDQWARWLEQPPTPGTLKDKFAPLANAFELDGDKPRFLQDFDDLDGESKPIANLLIEAPGAQTLKQNTDHFIKRGQVKAICPSCTAVALFTLQTNAPGGGRGHRTSLRGSGPLCTLIALDPASSGLPNDLWRSAWLNVLDKPTLRSLPGSFDSTDLALIFPWLTYTRTSEEKTGCDTTPMDAHPLQMYWGMPRRIEIHWQDITRGNCDLCGASSERLVEHYSTLKGGTNYSGAWQHPLTPHRINSDDEVLPCHPQPGGVTYRQWLGLTSGNDSDIPALVVKVFIKDRKLKTEQLLLHAFGYDMDNMKARCWYETTFPFFMVDEAIRDTFTARALALVDAASNTANLTRSCIKDAWFNRPGDAKGDTAFVIEAFLSKTENCFFAQLKTLIAQLEAGEDGRASLYAWQKEMSRAALALFDYWTDRGDFAVADPRRIAQARRKLSGWLHGKSKGLHKLLEITDGEKAA